MKQIHQIVFFLGCLLSYFIGGVDGFDGISTTHTNPITETYLLEEEREACEVAQSFQEEEVEISGGNPDLQPTVSFQNLEENQRIQSCTVLIKDFATYSHPYFGKLPLYIKYQSLKLQC